MHIYYHTPVAVAAAAAVAKDEDQIVDPKQEKGVRTRVSTKFPAHPLPAPHNDVSPSSNRALYKGSCIESFDLHACTLSRYTGVVPTPCACLSAMEEAADSPG